jgi:hypothetical protein
VLGRPLSHDCLARILTVKLAAKDRDKSVEFLNTAVRGQVVLGIDESADIDSINGMLQLMIRRFLTVGYVSLIRSYRSQWEPDAAVSFLPDPYYDSALPEPRHDQ